MITDRPEESIWVVYSLDLAEDRERLARDMRAWGVDRIVQNQLSASGTLVEFLPGVPKDLGELS